MKTQSLFLCAAVSAAFTLVSCNNDNTVNNTNLNLIHLISPGDLNSMIQPYGSITGIMGKPSAHMPESEKCNYEDYGSLDISYSYTLDDEGRITSVDISSGGQKSTVKIGY